MRRFRGLVVALAVAAPFLPVGSAPVGASLPVASPPVASLPVSSSGSAWVLTTTQTGGAYAPTFLGNGYIGERIPAAGTGYSASPVATDSQLEGFYGQDAGLVQQRANIPIWSTLAFSDGSGTFGEVPVGTLTCGPTHLCPLPGVGAANGPWQGSVAGYQQSLDLFHGVLTTSAAWRSPGGRVTDLSYSVIADRVLPHVAVVRLAFTPRWSGAAVVSDLLDGTDTNAVYGQDVSDATANAVNGAVNGTNEQLTVSAGIGDDVAARQVSESTRALGTGLVAGIASTLSAPAGATVRALAVPMAQSVGQQATIPIVANTTYTVTKYVAVRSSNDSAAPAAQARSESAAAARDGYDALLAGHERAWAALWHTDIRVGDPDLQRDVRASLFYLLESTRAGSDWSLSPGGLSSPGYNGHVFWDAETWMFPALLATHPDMAVGIDDYRYRRLGVARQFASLTGFKGARFPWESALTGDDQSANGFPADGNGIDPLSYFPGQRSSGDSVDTGEFEQHVTGDVALAQWQYYLATGDKHWLATIGWPVLQGAAEFWASHAVRDPEGGFDLDHVMGPDEYHGDLRNSAYVNVAALTTLRDAAAAARELGHAADPRWLVVAAGLARTVPYQPRLGIHPEYDGYDGVTVKQADTVMLTYPWQFPMPAAVAQNDLDYYQARTDPDGPSMTDAIHAIDASAIGSPGCASYYFLRRSVDPFMRPPFAQFSETRLGGPFDFVTAVGGFLQEFLYGFSGLRWDADAVVLAPTLPPQIPSVTLQNLSWRGRELSVAIGRSTTVVSLTSGAALPVRTPRGTFLVRAGKPVRLHTQRPALTPTADVARCRPVTASSADPSFPAVGAVDGDATTEWKALSQQASLQVDLGSVRSVDRVDIAWGASRGTTYTVSGSPDGTTWLTLADAPAGAATAITGLSFRAVAARYLRIAVTATTSGQGAEIDELSAYRPSSPRRGR